MARPEGSSDPTKTFNYRAQEFVLAPVISRLVTDWLPRISIITDATQIIYPDGFHEKFAEAIRAGCIPVGVANHTSHYDFYEATKVAQDWMEIAKEHQLARPKGIYLPGTSSMFTGHQGPLLKEVQTYIKDKAKQSNIDLVMITRRKDEKKYGLKPNADAMKAAINQAPTNGYGFLLLPEGTVKGGAHTGPFSPDRHGLQKPEDSSLDFISIMLRRKGLEPVFVSVGIVGSYDVYTAGKIRLPTMRAIQAVRGKADPRIVKIQMGMPQRWSEIPTNGQRGTPIEDFMMRDLASWLPKRLRGYYQ